MTIPAYKILVGDWIEQLRTLPDASVHCCVTSPPYWGLRDYGVAGQLGLEKTPEEYVAKIVAGFREVRRVLRDDGTLWLNLGDCYCSQGGLHDGRDDNQLGVGAKRVWRNGSGRADGIVDERGQRNRNGNAVAGLKPKDLVGIPWRVAFALQQPYYTGRIKDERDRIWLAAIIEAEGCMFIHKRNAGTPNYSTYEKKDGTITEYDRKRDTYGAGLEVANTDRAIVEKCMAIAGIGSICEQSPKANPRRKQTIYRWNVRSNECRWIIRELYPHFVAKQLEARLVLGCPSFGPDAEKAHASLKSVHQGGNSIIDFSAPESLFEPGWWLRQEIIWHKPGPMPESVRDRCTKSHEYIFLLTKSVRYFYDAEAVKEPVGESFANDGRWKTGPTPENEKDGYAAHKAQNPKSVHRVFNGDAPATRNKRSVWTVATAPYAEAHFATFPPDLIKPCILAGTSARGVCPQCGAPWERVVNTVPSISKACPKTVAAHLARGGVGEPVGTVGKSGSGRINGYSETLGWQPTCKCGDLKPIPATVLDPFLGSGTTAQVALELGRFAIGIELNPAYVELGRKRCAVTPGLSLA